MLLCCSPLSLTLLLPFISMPLSASCPPLLSLCVIKSWLLWIFSMLPQKKRLWVSTPPTPLRVFEDPYLCLASVTVMMREAFKCFFSFPFFSSALPVGDNKYLWTSDSISMLSQYYKWHHPNLRRVLKLIDLKRKGNHGAVSTSSPCQAAAWCCRGMRAFSFDYQGLLERIEIVDVFCLGLNRIFFSSCIVRLPLACLPDFFIFLFLSFHLWNGFLLFSPPRFPSI